MSLTVQDGLAALTRYFENGGVGGAVREARLLLAHVMGVDASQMTMLARDPLDADLLDQAYAQGARRRFFGEPMSHILGYREFWGRRFHIDSRVLDPRPETETLVKLALQTPFGGVLDLGTGSGCILLTLLAERPDATGIGVDVSADALAVAEGNAKSLGVAQRCTLMPSDWFSYVAGRFDLIVSNPPYIAADEMAGLQSEVTDHEPRLALDGGADGLDAYRAIAAGVKAQLAPGGRLLVEIGPTQAQAVADLFVRAGLENIAVHPDLDGRDRVVSGVRSANN